MSDKMFICPQCGGPHFNLFTFTSEKGGTVTCASVSFKDDSRKIGCGWRGTIPARPKPNDQTPLAL